MHFFLTLSSNRGKPPDPHISLRSRRQRRHLYAILKTKQMLFRGLCVTNNGFQKRRGQRLLYMYIDILEV